MTRPIAILIFLLAMPFFTLAHGDKNPFSLSGVIVEDGTARGVSGAIISIEKNGEVIQSTETDANGNFILKMDGYMPRMDQVKVTVQKRGYKSQRIRPVGCLNQNLQIRMQKQSPIPIIKPVGGGTVLSI